MSFNLKQYRQIVPTPRGSILNPPRTHKCNIMRKSTHNRFACFYFPTIFLIAPQRAPYVVSVYPQAWSHLHETEHIAGRVQAAAVQALLLLSFGNANTTRQLAGELWCWGKAQQVVELG